MKIMSKFLITFMSSGALTVEADNEETARAIFENNMREKAAEELKLNGIDITEVSETPDD
ncbi:hypothetical protein [uncultured Bacteroides sp.]|uniref:hypothetical protein n=1 Tax=uncultured Bacteroides sp. TaxID=162156 RepID=UPI002598FA67|nr:hypothetical protein [uncultured Bacteroides sp.]